jgi:hypothetical protein
MDLKETGYGDIHSIYLSGLGYGLMGISYKNTIMNILVL